MGIAGAGAADDEGKGCDQACAELFAGVGMPLVLRKLHRFPA